MEPRTLINENGSLTRSTGRRVTSAEFMTNAMREDLINTPVRTYGPQPNDDAKESPAKARHSLGSVFDGSRENENESTELSSTYNSPTTTMNVRNPGISTPTELIGWDPATSATPAPTPGPSRNALQKTPLHSKQAHAKGMMSAPPKQTNQSIFAAADQAEDGGKEDDMEEKEKLKLNGRLESARRKTMGWRPRVGSPLGKL